MSEDTKAAAPVADPAPLGLAAFAATTFLLSVHNALGGKSLTLLAFFGLAVFYGGAVQVGAGMWEFRNRNAFGATAFSTYGGFWMALATFVTLFLLGKVAAADLAPALGYFLLAFTIFTAYMLIASSRTNLALFVTFLALEITLILLVIGNFSGAAAGSGLVALGGWAGIATAALAWYCSAAALINGMAGRTVLPVGAPIWGAPAAAAAAPLSRAQTQV
jgi:succinate-acetate transporter protein